MGEIYKETFKFAKITVFKNYSNLDRKVVVYDSDPPDPFTDIEDPFSDTTGELKAAKMITAKKHVVSADIRPDTQQSLHNINLYEKSPLNYFYTNNPTDSFVNHAKKGQPIVKCDVIKLVNAKPRRKHDEWSPDHFETTKEKHIKRHYYNPFAEIQVTTLERWIKREGDIVKIKFFRQEKSRNVGVRYFRKVTVSTTVTFDMKRGNFLIVTYDAHKKIKRKHFFSNSFTSLERALPTILGVKEYGISKTSSLYEQFKETFHNDIYVNKLLDQIEVSAPTYNESIKYDAQAKTLVDKWMRRFVELKEIKMPDNGYHLLKYVYPTEKYLKKNDRKLIAAMLDRYGILSKFTVKLVHEIPSIDIKMLFDLHSLFGDDAPRYMGNINPKFFGRSEASFSLDGPPNYRIMRYDHQFFFPIPGVENFEKENIVHIINDSCQVLPSRGSNIINEIFDHFRMMEKLRIFYPDLHLTMTKHKTFSDEHSRLAGLERDIKKGYSIQRLFNKEIIEAIEKPIEMEYWSGDFKTNDFEQLGHFIPNKKVYEPVLLKTSEEYTEEGATMHHCVAGYVDRSRSIIVSLRHGDERVTCEFDSTTKKCIQARYYQNQAPPEHFQKPLEKLKEKISMIPFSVGPREVVKVPLKINGIEVKIKAEDEDLF